MFNYFNFCTETSTRTSKSRVFISKHDFCNDTLLINILKQNLEKYYYQTGCSVPYINHNNGIYIQLDINNILYLIQLYEYVCVMEEISKYPFIITKMNDVNYNIQFVYGKLKE